MASGRWASDEERRQVPGVPPEGLPERRKSEPVERSRAEPRPERDAVDDRPRPSGWDEVVDESFPASDPPPGPVRIGSPRRF